MVEKMDLRETSIGLDRILIVSSMVANIGQTIHCYQTIVEVYQALKEISRKLIYNFIQRLSPMDNFSHLDILDISFQLVLACVHAQKCKAYDALKIWRNSLSNKPIVAYPDYENENLLGFLNQ